jgi:hypothetical protein
MRMHAVTWGPAGFVAVGSTSHGPAAWISADGTSWSRADEFAPPSQNLLFDVVDAGDGYVALGHVDGRTAAWESADGRRWAPLDTSGILGTGRAIAARNGDVVVVGSRAPEVGGAGAWFRPSDGAWRDAVLPVLQHQPSDLGRVASTSTGFLALGPSLVSSPDGATWVLEGVSGSTSAVRSDAAEGDGRLVVVGTDAGRPAAWAGLRPGDLVPVEIAGRGSMVAVAYHRGVFIAVGDGPGGAFAWTSADGRAWQPAGGVADGAGSRMVDVATDGHRLVAVGARGTQAAAWAYEEIR